MKNTIVSKGEKNGRHVFLVFLFVLFLIICFYPYEFNSIYLLFLPQRSYELSLLFLLPLIFAFAISNKSYTNIKTINILLFLQWFGLSLVSLKRGNINASLSQTILFVFIFLLVYFVRNSIGFSSFFKKYNRWIFLMAAMGVVTWAAVSLAGYSPLFALPDRANPERLIYNYGLSFAVLDENMSFRYSGFFDEPGAMGLWGLYALLINRLFIKEKWMEIPLILCLLLTFSVGYYLQLFVFILLFGVSKGNKMRGVLIAASLLLAYYFVLLTENTTLSFIYDMSIGRMENMQTSSESSLFVENRAEATNVALKEFLNNPILGTDKLDLRLGNNIFEPLALYGIVGSFFILFPFFWIIFRSFKLRDYDVFKAGLVIISGFFHRPFHSNVLYYFILYGFIILFLERNNKIQAT